MRPWWWTFAALAACAGAPGDADAGRSDVLAPGDRGDVSSDNGPFIEDTPPCDAPPTDVGAVADAPTPCCTQALCAPHAMRCDPASCRCAMVPCQGEGDPCDPRSVPGLDLPLVCTRDLDGLFCHPSVTDVSRCPPGLSWCSGGVPCVCGAGACRVFGAACPVDRPCQPLGDGVAGSCNRTAYGYWQERTQCSADSDCAAGLLCLMEDGLARCLRPSCGLVAGAPTCPAGQVCRMLRRSTLLGVCRVPCDPLDVRAPCADNERCLATAPDEPARCTPLDPDPLPAPGAPCGGYCRTGAHCIDGICLRACRPGARAGDPAACAEGTRCVGSADQWYCAVPCDPWRRGGDCVGARICVPALDACERVSGRCALRPEGVASEGAQCFSLCESGLACSRFTAPNRCRKLCVMGETAGPRACPDGTRCVANDPADRWGACLLPCVAGDGTCPAGEWCRPVSLDPETDRWTGYCG